MKKFEGWRTDELQYVATVMVGRVAAWGETNYVAQLYHEIIKEIRNRRVKNELHQMTLAEEYQRKALEEE